MKKNKVNSEYQDFLDSNNATPSQVVSDQILEVVHRELNPNPFLVFSKLMGIHFVTALATLSVCPQFGFRVFGEGMGLMHYFMNLGEHGCLVACGAFFTGTSILIAGFVLQGEELRAIRKNRVLELGALVLLSLGFFIMRDVEVIFGLTAAWFFGAMLGSVAALELTWGLRFRNAQG